MAGTCCDSTSAGADRRVAELDAQLCQEVLDLPYEVSDSYGLEQYICTTRIQALLARSRIPVASHRQSCPRQRVALAQLLENLEAVAVRQRDVEENEVGRSRCRNFHRLRNGSRNIDIVPRFTKENAERVGNERAVLHNEDS